MNFMCIMCNTRTYFFILKLFLPSLCEGPFFTGLILISYYTKQRSNESPVVEKNRFLHFVPDGTIQNRQSLPHTSANSPMTSKPSFR
ncbi:hypothetical protein EDC14_101413 [Hydrogenispora ethanolica]|uniref:Uncharacterized protein n=1 Tax=Hydrogenispora ethanolica TaxID=1082276 RepID=A0A4R1RM41_HYDET|nr:hypothetical protein EDC14_101413 [Hydrogenispora ethanolica]